MPLLTCPCEKNAPMQPINRHGVEIDVCTQCKGVWLDRGELEKLMTMMRDGEPGGAPAPSAAPQARPSPQQPYPQAAPPPQPQPGYAQPGYGYGGERGEYGEAGEKGYYDPRTGQYRKKKGFDFFDFFD